MAVSNISTYAVFQSTLNDISKVIAELTTQQTQLSSGSKSQDFLGMASQAEQFLSLESNISKANSFIDNNTVILNRINATNTALTQIIDVATTLKGLIAQRRGGSPDGAANFDVQLVGQWQQIVNPLNTKVGDTYLFSGTRTDTQAVNDDSFPTLFESGVPDAGYYLGNDGDLTLRAADNISITYNVRANDEAFQKIFAGLAMARQGNQNGLDEDLAAAYDLVNEGLQGVISLQAMVNSNKVAVDSINQNHQTFKLYWQGVKENIGNADIVAVSTQVAINQGILQAAFQAFAKINSLRLSDFLR